MLDDRIGEVKVHGKKIDPKRRHIFTDVAADHTGEARVALKDLAYDDAAGHLMFPETVGVFEGEMLPLLHTAVPNVVVVPAGRNG